jgi:hypothetical protein
MGGFDFHDPRLNRRSAAIGAFQVVAAPRIATDRSLFQETAFFEPIDERVDLAFAGSEIAHRRVGIDLRELICGRWLDSKKKCEKCAFVICQTDAVTSQIRDPCQFSLGCLAELAG